MKKLIQFVMSLSIIIALISCDDKDVLLPSKPTTTTTTTSAAKTIGQSFQGGIIFYLETGGEHGLVVAPSSTSTSLAWATISGTPGAYSSTIGDGQTNTTTITNYFGAGNYAAKKCQDLIVGSYSDWYLPSRDELILLHTNKSLDATLSGVYWSSTEYNSSTSTTYAYSVNFATGSYNTMTKSTPQNVRAIASF